MSPGQKNWAEDIDTVCDNHERFERLRYGPDPGAEVVGYPAKGGLYAMSKASSVEVEFLGFSRFDTAASNDTDTEEALCDNMRRLGAVWWKTQYDYTMSQIGVRSPRNPKRYIFVGWPAAGGIWVLTATELDGKSTGIIHNAHSMEERCTVIEKLGGKFYENPKDCLDLDLP
ncbi:hypothetical protein SCUCBS95973_003091 [Sporothrix curviconia]|uniref:Uncharacterized protein n=1 Tax=Sporothrix curviconia TaxID=1260050 RepID=A0ABP0BCB6_9PEZI